MNEGLLSVKNASGRQVSLLNTNDEPQTVIRVPTSPTSEDWSDSQQSKRKYHCVEPGCNKSFTTSGHLARHNRIHTGEKNFPCLFPGCQSRFSRQDNMMQHYRTHMSPKSRRSQKRGVIDEARPRPRLHAHHRIKSDPVQIEPPLTIDQHLSNYHQSLRSSPLSTNSRFNFPVPLSSIARTPSTLKKVNTPPSQNEPSSPSPTLSHSSSTSLPSIHHIIDETIHSRPTSPDNNNNEPSLSPSNSSTTLFYQHRPLTFSRPQNSGFPYTLLHPAQGGEQGNVTPNQGSGNYPTKEEPKEDPMDEDESPSTDGLHQLAHIVSTFG
ncbi:hypothetical protein EDC94DRAFT_521822 [Helicostylum pulchrum]|uniref:C2H2-type domain-containing protein n=1 Tax=Helicostylum pulchrum TaxID=562976 RepID=A0ABP9YE11_9FUNG|nr:hypothetical protein EDC94DRAFT_521822 [Helicostylum pulchrum]